MPDDRSPPQDARPTDDTRGSEGRPASTHAARLLPVRQPTPTGQRVVTEADTAANLRIAVHDRSRLEWVATVPVAKPGETHTWDITLQADVPDAIWVHHAPWDHFQVRSRLTSPMLAPGRQLVGPPIDQLRRRALAVVHQLKSATVALVKPLQVLRRTGERLSRDQADQLAAQVLQVAAETAQARSSLEDLLDDDQAALARCGQHNQSSDALVRELGLAEEYISNQLLMLLTRVTQSMGPARVRSQRKVVVPLLGHTDIVDAVVRQALEAETAYRSARQMRWVSVKEAGEIEAFVHRAALLKKHFQQALFLDARAYMLDQRLRNWIAATMAMIASSFYFVWQIWILNTATSAASTTVSLVVACAIAALIYAAKDRIKEVGRDWLTRRVKLQYADRVAHLSLQHRMDARKTEFALARETIKVDRRTQPDPLNPALGDTQVVHNLQICERLRHTGLPLLHQQGLVGLKHVFRYDMSPLLVKLDDQRKRVLMMDAQTGKLRTRSGTRVYLIPITVQMTLVGTETRIVQRGVLRMRRSGLERFVPMSEGARRRSQVLAAATQSGHPAGRLVRRLLRA